MTATSLSATDLYLFFTCWLAAAIVLGFALYYVWDRLEKRSRRAAAALKEPPLGKAERSSVSSS
jgi:predicted PurR-regulated permease PerM